MQIKRWAIQIGLWLLLGLLSFGQPLTWAAAGDVEYRFERMVPQLEQPWYFDIISGLTVAKDGSIWVSDYGYNRVQHFSSNGQLIAQADGQFNGAGGVALADDGSIWVVDSYNNRIQHFSTSGKFIEQFGSLGSAPGQLNNPTNVAFAGDGSFWVVDFGNGRIQHLSAAGKFIAQIGYNATNSLTGQENSLLSENMAVAPDGSIWLVDTYGNRVQHFNAMGQFTAAFGKYGSAAGQLNHPEGIALTSEGNLWVVDTGNSRLQLFSARGQFIKQFGSEGKSPGKFIYPEDIAVSPDGSLWIAENTRLQHFTSDGAFIGKLDSKGENTGEFNTPVDVAEAADGSIWVVDLGNNRLQHLTSEGVFIESLGNKGSDPGQFEHPFGIAITSSGNIWVADSGNNRLQYFDHTGKFISQVGSKGSAPGQFDLPVKISVAPDDSIWILDKRNERIQHLSSNGAFIAEIGQQGSAPGQFSSSEDMAIAPDGSIWVADTFNFRLQHFSSAGKFIALINNSGRLSEVPRSITVAPDHTLWVGDSWVGRNRLLHLNTDGKLLEEFGSKGSAAGQFSFPKAKFTVDGNLWVVDMGNHRIQKFVPRQKGIAVHPYKAIILAGGGESYGGRVNDIWDGTWRIANKAYKALNRQAFKVHDEIKFLTAGSVQFDLDNNGKFDDLEPASKDSLRRAITEWASDAKDVVIFLANHGGSGTFRINGEEILTSEELNTWVNQLKKTLPGKITVVIEACNSASFFDPLSAPERYVFASAKADQAAVIANDGLNSFSFFFWSEVATGAKLKNAFKDARQAMSATKVGNEVRNAQADTDGDRQFTQSDLDLLGNYYLGNGNTLASDSPIIKPLSPASKTLKGDKTYAFTLNLTHTAALNNAWALVQRPDDISIDSNRPLNFEKIPLTCSYGKGQSQCQGHYDRFDVAGEYRLTFYALDAQEEVSSPESLVVTQTQGQSIAPVAYDDQQTTIYLRDVMVGGGHYQAALQLQNGQFVLLPGAKAAPVPLSPPAVFDAASNILTIPLAKAYGQNYQATLKHLGNYVFQLQQAGPK